MFEKIVSRSTFTEVTGGLRSTCDLSWASLSFTSNPSKTSLNGTLASCVLGAAFITDMFELTHRAVFSHLKCRASTLGGKGMKALTGLCMGLVGERLLSVKSSRRS